jgi:hypothetical protein
MRIFCHSREEPVLDLIGDGNLAFINNMDSRIRGNDTGFVKFCFCGRVIGGGIKYVRHSKTKNPAGNLQKQKKPKTVFFYRRGW